jgi:hypothetical protein
MLKKILTLGIMLTFTSFAYAQQESVTITTYYPSPYGSYRELRSQRMAIGDNYINRSAACWDPPCPGGGMDISDSLATGRNIDLFVEGSVGIGTRNFNSALSALHIQKHGLLLPEFGNYPDVVGMTIQAIDQTTNSLGIELLDKDGKERGGLGLSLGAQWSWAAESQAGDVILRSRIGRILFATETNGQHPYYPTKMVITHDGNVGIGTTSTERPLKVVGQSSIIYHTAAFIASNKYGVAIGGVGSNTYGDIQAYRDDETGSARYKDLAINASGGNVGIGTTNPIENLSVQNDNSQGEIGIAGVGDGNLTYSALYLHDNTADNYSNWVIAHKKMVGTVEEGDLHIQRWITPSLSRLDLAIDSVTGYVGIGTTNPGSYRLYVNGNQYLNGQLNIKGDIYGADIAEDIKCLDSESGDAVVIDPEYDRQVKKSAHAYDSTVVGVISEKPSLYIGKNESKNVKPLALVGQVKCKVTTENGSIKRGALLVTSSKPGYAMRADLDKIKPGMLIGKALESLEEGEGKISVLITGI